MEVRFKFGFGFLGCVKGKNGTGRKTNLSVDMGLRKMADHGKRVSVCDEKGMLERV